MSTICLSIIVKNEAHVITRCLNSVKPLVDYYFVHDTGSTDGTQESIRQWLKENNLKGEVIDVPWKNFSYNRSEVLKGSKDKADYSLMIDADEIIVFKKPPVNLNKNLTLDIYYIETRMGGSSYFRPQLTSNKINLCYKGVVHEYLECPTEATRGRAEDFFNKPLQDSARNQSGDKFKKDIEMLHAALENETDEFLISRYSFYLANSYKDDNQPRQALFYYIKASKLCKWSEEVFWSLYKIAELKEQLKYSHADIIEAYLAAHQYLPTRMESLHGLMRFCRLNKREQLGYMIGKTAITKSRPPESLFSQDWVYDYGLIDEYAILAYWAGDYKESQRAGKLLLFSKKFPPDQEKRIRDNLKFAEEKL